MCLSSWKYIKIGIFFLKGRYGFSELLFSICCCPAGVTASINSTGRKDGRWDTARQGVITKFVISQDISVDLCRSELMLVCEKKKTEKGLWLDSSTLATTWELTIINPCPNISNVLLLMRNASLYHTSVSIEVHWLKSKCKYRFWCIHFD